MMETPEKEKLLETVRALRKEATEKLTGNRHDQAIQRLDDILEVVEKQDMSSAEISAVSNVLVGKVGDAPSAEPVEALVEMVSEAPDKGSADIVFEEGQVGAVSVPEVAVGESVVLDGDEVIVDQGTPEIDVVAVPEVAAESATASEVPETVVEEPSGTDMGTVAALGAVGAGALVAGAIAKNLVGETAETAPEAELADGGAEVPLVDLAEAQTTEVATPEVVEEAAALPAELVEVTDVLEVEAPGVAVPDLEVAPEVAAIKIESLEPVEVLDMEQVSEADLPAEGSLQEVEIAASASALPEVESVIVVEPEIAEIAEHIPDVEASPQITDIAPDIDPAKAAIVAAGAAATVAAVSGGVVGVGAVSGEAAPRVLTGSSLKRHPSYGGGRGNWFVRFINTLRGKDYI